MINLRDSFMKSLFLSILAVGMFCASLFVMHCVLFTPVSTTSKPSADESAQREQDYPAYRPLADLREKLCVSNYSSFENPTGIFVTAGETFTAELLSTPRTPVKLIIHNFEEGGEHSEHPLSPGTNSITAPAKGLCYIDYRDSSPESAPAVRIRISGGQINGVFRSGDNTAVWQQLLANAKCNILDMVGERVQLAYNVDALRANCPTRGPELLALYDEIIRHQHELMGWEKYGHRPGNHIHGRVQWRGFMHADGTGAAFVNSAIAPLVNPEKLRATSWPVAHEFGHINQVRPGFMWAGSQEVTNNLYSVWSNFCLNPANMRLEHEICPSSAGVPMRGGRFDCYVNNALVHRQLWQFTTGPDTGIRSIPGERTGDHFVSVCPVWQLQLYVAVVLGKKDFYADILEAARTTDSSAAHGQLRVNYFLHACRAAGLDLSEFFIKTGILAPMNRWVTDYSSHQVTITRSMIEQARAAVAHLPKPDSSVIFYINSNNYQIFRDRCPVIKVGSDPGFTAAPGIGGVTISPDVWQNAVAYEAYVGDKLVRIALRGLNHEDNATTDLSCPPGITRIAAVQWDGTRHTIWQSNRP